VVAAGLLAALRGERQQARCLLLIADARTQRFTPRKARAIARDWLVADAARSGDWREVIRLGRRGRLSVRWSYAMARIAERLIGDPHACRDWLLWLCFLMAPRRRMTLSLLRRALAIPVRSSPRPDAKPATSAGLPQALAGLAHALAHRRARDGQALAWSVSAVDGALDPVRPHVEQRLSKLGGRTDADAVISAFRQRLVGLMVPLLEEDPILARAADRGPIVDQAIEQVRLRLFRDIEAQCKDYNERTENLLDALFEWERWAKLRNAGDRLLALEPTAERTLFQAMYVPVCNYAVFQHNKCQRIPLAHDMFSWLLLHAEGDAAATQLLTKNAKAGRAG
jgi:hypothetical protein